MPDTLSPITREETYLAAIAGEDVTTPDPICRKEEFLDAIDDHIGDVETTASGAASAVTTLQTQIPASTAEDSGKVLTAGSTAGTATWANVPKELPASLGTAGQVLTVNAGSTGVEWATPSGGGGSVLEMTDATLLQNTMAAAAVVAFQAADYVMHADTSTSNIEIPATSGITGSQVHLAISEALTNGRSLLLDAGGSGIFSSLFLGTVPSGSMVQFAMPSYSIPGLGEVMLTVNLSYNTTTEKLLMSVYAQQIKFPAP